MVNIHMTDMQILIKQYLLNQLPNLKGIDASVAFRDFSKLTIIKCDLRFSREQYISALKNSNSVVVLLFDDHFWYSDLSNNNTGQLVSETLMDITNVVSQFNNKRIILVTENFYTEQEIEHIKPPNLSVVVVPYFMYTDTVIEAVNNIQITKALSSNSKHVLCLNNNPRPHRVGTVLYLTSLNITSAHISFMSAERWDSNNSYDYNTILSFVYPYGKVFDKLQNISLRNIYKNSAEYVYVGDYPSDCTNFEKLKPLYETTVVEIITETTSLEYTATLTEKFVNCVNGKCFPIIIGTYKNVELYRNMGYDMFDDIIDHSYDYEPNPFYRMKMAIDLNIEIITNVELAISLYNNNQERFEDNIKNYKKQYSIILGNTIGDLDSYIGIDL